LGTISKDHDGGANSKLLTFGIDNVGVASGKFTFSDSYTTGGEALDLSNEFKKVIRVIVGSFPVTATVAAVKYVGGKLVAYDATGTEIAAETDLSTVVVEFIAAGLV
jgi:hypothetical protein